MLAAHEFFIAHAQVQIVGVDLGLEAGFGIDHDDFPGFWQFRFERVHDTQGDGFVFAGEFSEWFVQRVREKIGDEENEGLAAEGADEEIADAGD